MGDAGGVDFVEFVGLGDGLAVDVFGGFCLLFDFVLFFDHI